MTRDRFWYRRRTRQRRICSLLLLFFTMHEQCQRVSCWIPGRYLGITPLPFSYQSSSSPRLRLASSKKRDESGQKSSSRARQQPTPKKQGRVRQQLKNERSKSLSMSKHRAISALSQPEDSKSQRQSTKRRRGNETGQNAGTSTEGLLPPTSEPSSSPDSKNKKDWRRRRKSRQGVMGKTLTSGFKNKSSGGAAGASTTNSSDSRKRSERKTKRPTKPDSSKFYSSLLPPPLTDSSTTRGEDDDDDDQDDPLSSGLSSWEEFLGAGSTADSSDESVDKGSSGPGSSPRGKPRDSPVTSSQESNKKTKARSRMQKPIFSDPAMSGDEMVSPDEQRLPSIQDLFPPDLSSTGANTSSRSSYQRPTQKQVSSEQLKKDDSDGRKDQPSLEGVLPVSDLFYRSSQSEEDEDHDDEELPFSAEQSDAVSSDHNKIRIRRNLAKKKRQPMSGKDQPKTKKAAVSPMAAAAAKAAAKKRKKRGPKMVRRGMEMLVGGVPINADPPQRSVELFYKDLPELNAEGEFEDYDWASTISLNTREFGPLLHSGSIPKVTQFERGLFCEYFCHAAIKWDVCPKDLRQIVKSYQAKTKSQEAIISNKERGGSIAGDLRAQRRSSLTTTRKVDGESSRTTKTGSDENVKTKKKDSEQNGDEEFFVTTGEFSFEIGVSREELESGEGGADGDIFRSVFARAFMSVLERAVTATSTDESEDFVVEIPKLVLAETDDGYTSVTVEFDVEAAFATSYADMERRVKKIGAVFTEAMDDGEIALAIAAAAKEETRWPESVRDRVVEECLFQDEDRDELAEFFVEDGDESSLLNESEQSDTISVQSNTELYAGGGDEGVFPDYSAANAKNAPYQGEIGLRLLDAVTERAKQRQPRVIAIGDIHGCVDELQDLLRQCDYRPGDLVCFLGDLVCKGPDSISVVQMAREIGAIGVRGNHDFEVVRWHQALKSGVGTPVVGSEHFHIASCLSKADMKWMYSLPWFISSKTLGTLFVHAGFVSGIRLAKQNPRLMMNMRSILPDGTVTSKFFNNWPWARLWDGPQTVLFGHDADRGLQQYEHAIGLDTGCVYGGRLTACILPEKRLVSVSARREYFQYRRKHYD